MRPLLLLAVLSLSIWLPVQAEPISIEKLIAQTTVVDGVANVYSPDSGVGQPDFAKDRDGKSVKQATGIDIGSQSIHTEAHLRRHRVLAATKWKGMRLILTPADLDACAKDKKYGLVLYCQVHYPLKGKINAIDIWYARGLRILNLQYSSEDINQKPEERLGGASDQTGGLTDLGRRVVDKCFRIGLMVDLSQCNEATTLEAAERAKRHKLPILKNHTATRGALDKDGKPLADYERNATDAELKAIASTGGVVGIMAYMPYLRRGGGATVADYVAHVEHAVKVAGIDHVGISTDGYLDGTMARNRRADGILDSQRRWFEVAKLLRKRGYTDEQLKKLLGGNFLRVNRKVLATAPASPVVKVPASPPHP